MGPLQAALTGCAAAKSSGSSSATSSTATCVASTNVTRGPYFVDNQSDPNIPNDDVDAWGACSPIANAQVLIWHCNAQGVYSDVQASSNDNDANLIGETFSAGISTPIQMVW